MSRDLNVLNAMLYPVIPVAWKWAKERPECQHCRCHGKQRLRQTGNFECACISPGRDQNSSTRSPSNSWKNLVTIVWTVESFSSLHSWFLSTFWFSAPVDPSTRRLYLGCVSKGALRLWGGGPRTGWALCLGQLAPCRSFFEVKSTWSKKSLLSLFDASFCGLHVVVSWLRRHPQLRFSSVANGLDTSGGVAEAVPELDTKIPPRAETIYSTHHQFSTDFLRFIRFLSV